MSISNPPIDNLSPFNPVKFGTDKVLTVDYLDSLFLSKRNTTESSAPQTTFLNLLKATTISTPTLTSDTKVITANVILKTNEITTNFLNSDIGIVNSTATVSAPEFRCQLFYHPSDITINSGEALNIVSDNDLIYLQSETKQSGTFYTDNISANLNTSVLIKNDLNFDQKSDIFNLRDLKVGAIFTQSPVNPVVYSFMGYEACERMTGGPYNLPSGPANSLISFKGPFSGGGASPLAIGSGYEINYVMNYDVTVGPSTLIFYLSFGGSDFPGLLVSIATTGTFLITYKASFQVTAGTINSATLLMWHTVTVSANNSTTEYKSFYNNGNANIVGIVGGNLTPAFRIQISLGPANWSASRREYTYIRRY